MCSSDLLISSLPTLGPDAQTSLTAVKANLSALQPFIDQARANISSNANATAADMLGTVLSNLVGLLQAAASNVATLHDFITGNADQVNSAVSLAAQEKVECLRRQLEGGLYNISARINSTAMRMPAARAKPLNTLITRVKGALASNAPEVKAELAKVLIKAGNRTLPFSQALAGFLASGVAGADSAIQNLASTLAAVGCPIINGVLRTVVFGPGSMVPGMGSGNSALGGLLGDALAAIGSGGAAAGYAYGGSW